MEIQHWSENTLPKRLSELGFRFIRRRFKEEWNITRNDVSHALLVARTNFILFDGDKLIGWLGLEPDREFTNACIEKGYHGTRLLRLMVRHALSILPNASYFAFVPIWRTGSARAFIANGFCLNADPRVVVHAYPEGDIELVNLERIASPLATVSNATVKNQLDSIRRLQDGTLN
jgi:hypothetical protein